MYSNIVFVCLVLCVVLVKTKDCQKKDSKDKTVYNPEALTTHKLVKRSKYFDTPPPGATLHRRPSYGFPPRSIISYTPPPNYQTEGDPPYPQPPRFYGSKPDGLGDENIKNIVKYLSKQDLDKIISFAGGRERDVYNKKVVKSERYGDYQMQVQSLSDEKFSVNGPYVKAYNDQDRPHQVEYHNPSSNSIQEVQKYINTAQVINIADIPDGQNYQQQYLGNTGNNLLKREVSNTLQYNQQPMRSNERDDDYLVTDQEEQLPRPVNLREDTDEAIAVAQTRQVASVARPDQSYKVENFGNLPVMDYHSKMFTVSSYNVPHYTITNSKSSYGSSQKSPPVEPAPPPSEAREQSDAHLKAIKIWSHRSKGQAYTLNDDGTLSLERQLRPKYGPYGQ